MSIRVGIVGVGKMGLSHFAIANAHPGAAVVAVCDTSRYVLSVLKKYAGIAAFTRHDEMFAEASLDAVIIATPTSTHFSCAKDALARNLHLFVEKPLTLSPAESRALSELAVQRKRVNQVGFHNRFIGTFQEARRLVRAGPWADRPASGAAPSVYPSDEPRRDGGDGGGYVAAGWFSLSSPSATWRKTLAARRC